MVALRAPKRKVIVAKVTAIATNKAALIEDGDTLVSAGETT